MNRYDANGNELHDPIAPWEEKCPHCAGGFVQTEIGTGWCDECEGKGFRLTDEGRKLLTFLQTHKNWFVQKGR